MLGASENKKDGSHQAKPSPEVVPLDRLAHVKNGERHEDRESDHLLHDLELRQ